MNSIQPQAESFRDSEAGKRIMRRLSDEHTLASLERLLGQVDQLSETITQIDELRRSAVSYSSIAVDTFDDICRRQNQGPDDMATRVESAVQLLDRLTQPSTMQMMQSMLDLAERLPGLLSIGVDILDEEAAKIKDRSEIRAYLSLLGHLHEATIKTQATETARVRGLVGLWRTMRDSDVQRGLGFFTEFLKNLGRSLAEGDRETVDS